MLLPSSLRRPTRGGFGQNDMADEAGLLPVEPDLAAMAAADRALEEGRAEAAMGRRAHGRAAAAGATA